MNNKDLFQLESLAPESEFDLPWRPEDEEISRSRAKFIRSGRTRSILARPQKRPRRPIPGLRGSIWSSSYGTQGIMEPGPPEGSEYVRWVQTILNQALNLQLPVDGVMNVQTRSAIRSFQEKNGFPPDGIVGPPTEAALIAASKGQPPKSTAAVFETFDVEASSNEWEGEVNRKSPAYIKWVQQSLNQIMGLKLVVDGKMGAQTRSAIRSFQQKHGLTMDGKVGPNTEAAIKAAQAGARAKPTLLQYLKAFSGPAAECTAALNGAGKTKAEALSIINAQIGVAIAMLRRAATDLKRGSRSSKTKDLFRKIFRVRPEFIPTWLKQTATIKDRGDVVAIRCKRVADLLASGRLKFFCTINSTNCPDCGNDPSDFACSSWGDHNVVCLGNAFWDAMKAGDTDSLLATLMHEPFHIYYGLYVTQHERRHPDGTLESVGKFGGIYCIQKFVFETNVRRAPDWVNQRCADTAVRKELEIL